MENKETLIKSMRSKSILEDTEYFKYIFKKTEKIVSAVFYVLRSQDGERHADLVVGDLEDCARMTLNVALSSLRSTHTSVSGHAQELRHSLVSLESKLRLAYAAQHMGSDLLDVFLHEIDSLQRSLRRYVEDDAAHAFTFTLDRAPEYRTPRAVKQRSSVSDGVPREQAALPQPENRRERILAVIKDKREASIKDIVEVIMDCSEKTIQRELNALIKDNIVHRDGERRWSKYKLI